MTCLIMFYRIMLLFWIAGAWAEKCRALSSSSSWSLSPTVVYRYFAYGSNMLPDTMTNLRSIRPIQGTAAVLPHYRLTFDGPWAATVRPTDDGECVHGVLYELTERDFSKVGLTEGVPWAYQWTPCQPIPYSGNGETAGREALLSSSTSSSSPRVEAYTLTSRSPWSARFNLARAPEDADDEPVLHIPPSSSYLRILQQGAAHWQLDRSYQIGLSKLKTARPSLCLREGPVGLLLASARWINKASQ